MRPTLPTLSMIAATVVACWLPGGAGAADGNALSSGPVAGSGAFGINDAIREGEARRGNALSTGPVGTLAPRSEYANLPVYVGKVGDKPVRLRVGPKSDTRDSLQGEYTIG